MGMGWFFHIGNIDFNIFRVRIYSWDYGSNDMKITKEDVVFIVGIIAVFIALSLLSILISHIL